MDDDLGDADSELRYEISLSIEELVSRVGDLKMGFEDAEAQLTCRQDKLRKEFESSLGFLESEGLKIQTERLVLVENFRKAISDVRAEAQDLWRELDWVSLCGLGTLSARNALGRLEEGLNILLPWCERECE